LSCPLVCLRSARAAVLERPTREHHPRPVLAQPFGAGTPDALRRPGDDGDLVAEIEELVHGPGRYISGTIVDRRREGGGTVLDGAVEVPWVISSDDHVIEPPHLWERWLPARYRDRGPRVEAGPTVEVTRPNGTVTYTRGDDGPIADWWLFEELV